MSSFSLSDAIDLVIEQLNEVGLDMSSFVQILQPS